MESFKEGVQGKSSPRWCVDQDTFHTEGPAGAKALGQEEDCVGKGALKVSLPLCRAQQGERKGLMCLAGRTATGRDGSQRESGLVEIGDGGILNCL